MTTPPNLKPKPCAAANGGGPSRLQSARLVAAVAELGSFGDVQCGLGLDVLNRRPRRERRGASLFVSFVSFCGFAGVHFTDGRGFLFVYFACSAVTLRSAGASPSAAAVLGGL